ncbi:MAG: hypothetical protein FGM32_00780 [Candidatus Kapabacteria bacterium]|nr:hypothetical protein [Candidatus Kapabacteria bacterium]
MATIRAFTPIAYCALILRCAPFLLASGNLQDEDRASKIYGDPSKIRVRNLTSINTAGLDYAPTVSADGRTLFFVSNREGSMTTGRKGEPSHDFWRVTKLDDEDTSFTNPIPLTDINTPYNEGVASISADRQKLYYAVCESKGGFGDCDIWEAQLLGERFIKPKMLGAAVNSKYWDSQPYIAPDGSRLYFASNRPRFDGESHDPDDYDIWYCDWDATRNEWKPARNLGDGINTPQQEVAPYIAPDGKTLFFSSNGHKPSIGGLDFYHTVRIEEVGSNGKDRWTTPELVPEPINSKDDDQFLSMPVSGEMLYFASRRGKGGGTKGTNGNTPGNFDIYVARVPKIVGAVNVVVRVQDACTEGVVPSKVTITNQLTRRTVEANVDNNREEINVVLSDKDFTYKGVTVDTVPLAIDITSPTFGKRHREIKLPITQLYSTDDISETISIDQRKRLYADMQSRDGRTQLAFNYNEEVIHQKVLPVVFFDRNSAEIPKRYRRIRADQRQSFRESFPPRSSLTDYYHVLNIVGSRMQALPSLKLTITGYRDEGTECDASVSLRRAESVRSYLHDVWDVDQDRISVLGRGWPKNRSNSNDSLGAEENRRCELLVDGPESDRDAFERPVTSAWSDASSMIPSVRFLTGRNGEMDDTERRIEIKLGEKVIRLLDVDPSAQFVTWDVSQDANAIMSAPASALRVSLIRVRTDGRECPCDTMSIPVEADQILKRGKQHTTPNVFRVHSFEAGTFEVDPSNQRYLSVHIVPQLKRQRDLQITGHTDVVGMYDHNQAVSERQAQSVAGILQESGVRISDEDVSGTGEDRPRYSNRFPEGRFYNRAVEIHTK